MKAKEIVGDNESAGEGKRSYEDNLEKQLLWSARGKERKGEKIL